LRQQVWNNKLKRGSGDPPSRRKVWGIWCVEKREKFNHEEGLEMFYSGAV